MTPKQYNFSKNIRYLVLVLGIVYLIFGAGAVFNGYKLTTTNYIMLVIVVLNLINAIFNKPTPLNEQTTRETPDTKQS